MRKDARDIIIIYFVPVFKMNVIKSALKAETSNFKHYLSKYIIYIFSYKLRAYIYEIN